MVIIIKYKRFINRTHSMCKQTKDVIKLISNSSHLQSFHGAGNLWERYLNRRIFCNHTK